MKNQWLLESVFAISISVDVQSNLSLTWIMELHFNPFSVGITLMTPKIYCVLM